MIEQMAIQFTTELEGLILKTVAVLPEMYVFWALLVSGIYIMYLATALNLPEEIIIANLGKITFILAKMTAKHYSNGLTKIIEKQLTQNQKWSLLLPSMPMMVCASAHGHRSVGQAGFSMTRDAGSGDDDGDDADNSDKVERDESHHGDKSSWERVLAKFSELSARLDNLEAITYADPNNG